MDAAFRMDGMVAGAASAAVNFCTRKVLST
jgi:hypothetical protein